MKAKIRHQFLGYILLLFVSLIWSGCDDPILPPDPQDPLYTGTGVFTYSEYTPFPDKAIQVYYHIPSNASISSPILFVFHGGDRNGEAYRNTWISLADQYNCMVFCPEFSNDLFPGGDAYNLGNVFVDGDNPSAATLNPEEEWTFSVIESLFQHVKAAMNSTRNQYDIFGFSAGGQFAHRLLMYKPDTHLGKVVAAGSGWYTVPDTEVDFPYGIAMSPAAQFDETQLYAKELVILVGAADNDPNSPGLRRNDIVDVQGTNRLERAQYFFLFGEQDAADIGVAFNWRYEQIAGVGHTAGPVSQRAAAILFE